MTNTPLCCLPLPLDGVALVSLCWKRWQMKELLWSAIFADVAAIAVIPVSGGDILLTTSLERHNGKAVKHHHGYKFSA